MSEAQLLSSVLFALRRLPHVHAMRLNSGMTVVQTGASRRSIKGCEAGTPDILCLLRDGRCVWLELKSDRGKVSATQAAWHAMAATMGHTVHVVRSIADAMKAVTA